MRRLLYAIIGSGAVGGLYGAMLHHSGQEVHFLFHRDYDHVVREGLNVESPWGNLHIKQINAYSCITDMPKCDVLCVCLKTTQNCLLPDLLIPVAKPGGVVLLLQNGLGAEEEVASLLPQVRVAGGLAYLCSNKVGPGRIHHVDYGQITIGAHSPGMISLTQQIVSDFRKAGIPVDVTDDLAVARWKKLVWNIPYNGLSVLLNTGTLQIMAHPKTRELVASLMHEVVSGACACGHHIEKEYVNEMLEFTDKMKPYSPSMKLDFDSGRPLEIEYIYERPLSISKAIGVEMPQVTMLTALLRFLDARRSIPKTNC